MIANTVPAGTTVTMLALLEVSSLERMLSPQVTSALTRACAPAPVGEPGTVTGGV